MQVSIDPRMIIPKSIDNDYKDVMQNYMYNGDDPTSKTEEQNTYEILKNNPEPEEESELSYKSKPTRYKFCFQKVNDLFKIKKIKKIIIWSCWIYVIKELFNLFHEKGYESKVIYGATEIEDREEYFHDFQKPNGNIQVLICNPASVSESVSLHQHCYDAVYFDMTWNALYYMQSKERIHRYTGKEKVDVNYHILIHKESIDEKIWKNIHNKETRMLETFESEELKLMPKSTQHLIDDVVADYIKKIKNY